KLVILANVIVLIVGVIFLGIGNYLAAKKNQQLQRQLSTQKTNGKIVSFLILFTDKVLKSNQEVSFDDRLRLENAVRDLNDPDILAKWQKFTQSQDQSEVQKSVVDLLETLVKKIQQ